MIDVKNLEKTFGDHKVLAGINEHIYPGEKVVVIGPSGSGKSTIAVELEKMLNDAKKAVYLLDGDNIRHGINSDYFIISPDLTVICCWDII